LSAGQANSSVHQHKFIIVSILVGVCFPCSTSTLQ